MAEVRALARGVLALQGLGAHPVAVAGGEAVARGHLLERLYREVRAPRIYEGTSEIQRTVIARELFKGTGEP